MSEAGKEDDTALACRYRFESGNLEEKAERKGLFSVILNLPQRANTDRLPAKYETFLMSFDLLMISTSVPATLAASAGARRGANADRVLANQKRGLFSFAMLMPCGRRL
jgi:hypothetical protein